jgi:GT2 family glycosyltransferase
MINSLRSVDLLKKLIIVDHSESDRISSFEVDFPTLVIRQPNKGYGAGLNRGLREIPDQNALVLLCNPDIIVPGSMQLVDALNYMVENPKIGCLIPSLVSEGAELQPAVRKFYTLASFLAVRNSWVGRVFPKLIGNHHYLIKEDMQPFEVDWGSGRAMLVRNSLFPYPISFDERFFLYFEDVDVCAQMWRHGFSVVH